MSGSLARRVRRAGIAALAFAASVGLCASAQACTKTWAAASGDWTVAAAWSPVGVPGATDDACLPASSDYR